MVWIQFICVSWSWFLYCNMSYSSMPRFRKLLFQLLLLFSSTYTWAQKCSHPHSSKIDTVGGANTFAPYCKSTFLRVVHFAFFSYLAPSSMTFSWPDGLGHVGLQRHVRFARRRVLGRRRQFVVTAARRPLFSEFCGCVQFSTKPRCIVEAATAFRGVNSVLLCLVCM